MKNEENKKQMWQTPEIIDLDLDLTKYSGSKANDGSSPGTSS
jgi:hypothetical protein